MKRLLLLICTLLFANVLSAQGFWEGDLYYNIIGGQNVYVYYCNQSATSVNIPSSVTHAWEHYDEEEDEMITDSIVTYNVTAIGQSAFYNCSSLTSVTIPNSVTSIGDYAFFRCSSLTSVTIPNSVTSIGICAFACCESLTFVHIPNSVTSIGEMAFAECYSLTSVTIPNSVTSISDGLFNMCTNLTNISIPNTITSIGEVSFWKCYNLTSVTIPNSVTYIGRSAFGNCSSLTSVTIPNSVTSIGEAVFYNCSSLTSVTLSNNITELLYDDYGNIGFFENCSSLTSITIPNSVTSIGDDAFMNCSSLTSVTIPNSVTYIGFDAFMNCSSLTSVTIPNSVTYIGFEAFYGCDGLTSVTCLATNPPSLGEYAFYDIGSPSTLYPPEGYSDEYRNSDWKDWFDCIVMDTTINATIMEGETYSFNGYELSEEGSYSATVLSVNGCEINLTINLYVISNDYTNGETSSLQETELEEIVFYPNPTKGLISFSKSIEKIEVVDISGKILLSFSNVREINIGDLPEGSYLLRLHFNENSVLRKIVKE